MAYLIDTIIDQLAIKNPKHANKLKQNLIDLPNEHKEMSEVFFKAYLKYLESIDLSLAVGKDCYSNQSAMFYFPKYIYNSF